MGVSPSDLFASRPSVFVRVENSETGTRSQFRDVVASIFMIGSADESDDRRLAGRRESRVEAYRIDRNPDGARLGRKVSVLRRD
jgi:hypothetical protein